MDVFVRDLVTGITSRVSLDSSGNQLDSTLPFNEGMHVNDISADGALCRFQHQHPNRSE